MKTDAIQEIWKSQLQFIFLLVASCKRTCMNVKQLLNLYGKKGYFSGINERVFHYLTKKIITYERSILIYLIHFTF